MANFVQITPVYKEGQPDTNPFYANVNADVFRFQAAPANAPASAVSLIYIKELKGNQPRLVQYYSSQSVASLVTAFGAQFIQINPLAQDLSPYTTTFYQNRFDIPKIKAPGTLDVARFPTATASIVIKEQHDNYVAVVTYLSAQVVTDLVTAAG